MGTKVEMTDIPPCDFCGDRKAVVDGRTIHRYWAYMCAACWSTHGCGRLGTGHGQKLVQK